MRNLWVLGAIFFALPSIACPDLNGSYISSRGQTLNIIQTGMSVQIGEGPAAIFDGVEHIVPAEDGVSVTYTGHCPNSDQMVLKLHVSIPSGESFDGTKTLTRTANGFHESIVGFEAVEEDWVRK